MTYPLCMWVVGGGRRQEVRLTFSFLPGQPLSMEC